MLEALVSMTSKESKYLFVYSKKINIARLEYMQLLIWCLVNVILKYQAWSLKIMLFFQPFET